MHMIKVLQQHKPVNFYKNCTTWRYLWNKFSQLPSTTIEWPIISRKCQTYRKIYATQQTTYNGTTHTKWLWFRPQFTIFFFVGIRCTRKKNWSKKRNNDPIKDWSKLKANLLKAIYSSNTTGFKMDEDPLQRRVYLMNLMNSLKFFLS